MFKNRTGTRIEKLCTVWSGDILTFFSADPLRLCQVGLGTFSGLFQRFLIRFEPGLCWSTQGRLLWSPRRSSFVWAVCLVWRCSFCLGLGWRGFCPDRMWCSDGWSSADSSSFYTQSLAQPEWTLSIMEVNLLWRTFSAADCRYMPPYTPEAVVSTSFRYFFVFLFFFSLILFAARHRDHVWAAEFTTGGRETSSKDRRKRTKFLKFRSKGSEYLCQCNIWTFTTLQLSLGPSGVLSTDWWTFWCFCFSMRLQANNRWETERLSVFTAIQFTSLPLPVGALFFRLWTPRWEDF